MCTSKKSVSPLLSYSPSTFENESDVAPYYLQQWNGVIMIEMAMITDPRIKADVTCSCRVTPFLY